MDSPTIALITVSVDDFERIIEAAITRALERAAHKPAPERILNKRELAADQKTSVATVTRWMQQGMPYLKGGHPRFRLSEVEAWRRLLPPKK
ncbi:MAG: hypothetical protein QM785_14335 [Pyrinomonadaceae bacterium]